MYIICTILERSILCRNDMMIFLFDFFGQYHQHHQARSSPSSFTIIINLIVVIIIIPNTILSGVCARPSAASGTKHSTELVVIGGRHHRHRRVSFLRCRRCRERSFSCRPVLDFNGHGFWIATLHNLSFFLFFLV